MLELRLPGDENMRRDCAMLLAAEGGDTSWRVYTWDGLWVSLGRNQVVEEVLVNPESTRWVRRPTGGAAVLHGHDVTVSIAMPIEVRGRDTYRAVTAPLVEALRACGVAATLAEDVGRESEYALKADCFASTTRNDIIDPRTLAKVCGCALRRTRSAVLLQASIPISEPLSLPDTIIRGGVIAGKSAVEAEELAIALMRQVTLVELFG